MIRRPISQQKKLFLGFIGTICLVAFYSALSFNQHQKNPTDTTIPNGIQLLEGVKKATLPDYAGKIWLLDDVKATYFRLGCGLSLAVVLALGLGILMGHFTSLQALSYPPLSFLCFIPSTAGLTIFMATVGTGEWLFISVVVFGAMPTLARVICLSAEKDVVEQDIFKFITMGASTSEVIYELSFKMILPRIISAVRLAVGPAMITLIALEMLISDIGFGYRLRLQGRLLNMNVCYFYCIVLGLIGLLIDQALVRISRKFCGWFEKAGA